jgi:glycerol-3-phosphate dehydrogenase
MTAWKLLKQGHHITLFEKGEVMKQTSSVSSKLLHGGLRYLENYEFRLVQEALKERQWWINQAPHLAQPLKLYIPIYRNNRRPAWMYKLGLWLYDLLAGKQNIGKHQSLNQQQIQQNCSELKTENLIKGFSYNYYFTTPITKQNITQSFAGLRPLIKSADNPNKATREYAMQQNQNLVIVLKPLHRV